jgi:hypothetical protein
MMARMSEGRVVEKEPHTGRSDGTRTPERSRPLRALLLTSLGDGGRRRPPPAVTLPFRFGEALDDGGGRYEARTELGLGQCGRVLRGVDRLLSVDIAVKLFAPPESEEAAAGVLAEARAMRRVRHPNVASVLDAGSAAGGVPYLVQEYIDGIDLERWRSESGLHAEPERLVRLVRDLALGVHAIHAEGLLHCDIAVRNILVDRTERPVLIDFGLAREDEPGPSTLVVGTPAFMPWEQWREGRYSVASDVAGLGAVLFWLLTGRFPSGRDPAAIEASHADPATAHRRRRAWLIDQGFPVEPDGALGSLVLQALHPDPTARPSSAHAFAEDLSRWLDAARALQTRRPRRVLRVLASVLGAAAAVAIALSLVGPAAIRLVTGATRLPLAELPTDRASLAVWLGTDADDPALATFYDTLRFAFAATEGDLLASPHATLALLERNERDIGRLPPGSRWGFAFAGAALALDCGDDAAADRWMTHLAAIARADGAERTDRYAHLTRQVEYRMFVAIRRVRSLVADAGGNAHEAVVDQREAAMLRLALQSGPLSRKNAAGSLFPRGATPWRVDLLVDRAITDLDRMRQVPADDDAVSSS